MEDFEIIITESDEYGIETPIENDFEIIID